MLALAQAELLLARKPQQVVVPAEMIRAKKTKGAAFTLACDASGLDDKEIAGAMNPPLDAGTFSRLKSGTNTLDADRVAEFCHVVGNTVYPEWQAYQVGCTLVMIKTEAERRAEEALQKLAQAEAENKLMRQLLQGRTA
ncbi:hypothetical protein [Methyloversatilis sp.]|uniref:hypothetical protein n=1 Tax=Methyloversatilis sp. TaxID=2569862 RepID=UPI003D2CF55B